MQRVVSVKTVSPCMLKSKAPASQLMDEEHYNIQFEFTTTLFPKKLWACVFVCVLWEHILSLHANIFRKITQF